MEKISNIEYDLIHNWLRNTFGNADRCESENCTSESEFFSYALKAGKRHARIRKNYLTLCKKCHGRYDSENKNFGHQTGELRNIKVPYALWKKIKSAAAEKGIKIYEEIEQKFK